MGIAAKINSPVGIVLFSDSISQQCCSKYGDSCKTEFTKWYRPFSQILYHNSVAQNMVIAAKLNSPSGIVLFLRFYHNIVAIIIIIGTTELILSNLVEPQSTRCLRTVNEVFVETLAKKIEKDPQLLVCLLLQPSALL